MELATGIARRNGRLIAVGVDDQGGELAFECGRLFTRGLPALGRVLRSVDVCFEDWTQTDMREYAAVAGISFEGVSAHVAWEFYDSGTRYVIPALALMRAMFRPNHVLFTQLFRPQSLESLCTYVGNRGTSYVRPFGLWKDLRCTQRSILDPLSWLYCFPSARSMWSSVYSAASKATLSLSLPKARARIAMRGRRVGRTFYVTSGLILSLSADEAPFAFAPDHAREIFFHVPAVKLPVPPCTRDHSIPLRDGQASLSDGEWEEAISFMSGRPGVPYKGGLRAVVDGVLQKQCFGTPWTRTTYPTGVEHQNAAGSFHSWCKSGKWEALRSLLRRRRCEA